MPARHLGDARRRVAGARLGRDRLRDVRRAAERRVAEHRVGGPRVERARRVQHRVRQLQARRGRSREALRRHDRTLDAEPLPRAVELDRAAVAGAEPARHRRLERHLARDRRASAASAATARTIAPGPDASTSSTPVRSTSSVTSRGASAASRDRGRRDQARASPPAPPRGTRPRPAPARPARRGTPKNTVAPMPAPTSSVVVRARRRPGRTRGRAATARRASRARASAPTEYAGSTRNAGVPSGRRNSPTGRGRNAAPSGSRTIAKRAGRADLDVAVELDHRVAADRDACRGRASRDRLAVTPARARRPPDPGAAPAAASGRPSRPAPSPAPPRVAPDSVVMHGTLACVAGPADLVAVAAGAAPERRVDHQVDVAARDQVGDRRDARRVHLRRPPPPACPAGGSPAPCRRWRRCGSRCRGTAARAASRPACRGR